MPRVHPACLTSISAAVHRPSLHDHGEGHLGVVRTARSRNDVRIDNSAGTSQVAPLGCPDIYGYGSVRHTDVLDRGRRHALWVASRRCTDVLLGGVDPEPLRSPMPPTASPVTLRPLRRTESDVLDAVLGRLSPRSRHLRFHTPVPRLTGTMRRAMLDLDDRRHVALVAENDDGVPVGLAQLVRTRADPDVAELAVVVVDAWHRRGVGRLLVAASVALAADWNVRRVTARVLPGNHAARRLFATAFALHLIHRDADADVLVGHLDGHDVEITMDDLLVDLVG